MASRIAGDVAGKHAMRDPASGRFAPKVTPDGPPEIETDPKPPPAHKRPAGRPKVTPVGPPEIEHGRKHPAPPAPDGGRPSLARRVLGSSLGELVRGGR